MQKKAPWSGWGQWAASELVVNHSQDMGGEAKFSSAQRQSAATQHTYGQET